MFTDHSRLTANEAQRYQGRYLVAERGLYTACDLCADDPHKPPLWQLRATRVTDDSESQDVIYRDAVVELDGVPIFYTPYFSHPEPSVKRRQGLLAPMGGSNSSLGTFVRMPYYFDVAPETDVTVTPTFSTKDGAQVSTEWRQRFDRASMRWVTSFTYADLVDDNGTDKGKKFRGDLFGETLYNFDNEWRAGSKIALSTDKSYLSRYSIAHDDVLVNRGFLENFSGRNYAVADMYYFEDTRPGAQLKEPLVAPEIRFNRLGEPNQTLGGRWSFDGGFLMTSRGRDSDVSLQGPDTRRVSMNGGWDRQFISSTGFLTDIDATVRSDTYWADNVAYTDETDSMAARHNGVFRERPFAQTDLTVRYPIGRRGDGYQQIIEPIAMLTAAPNVSAHALIPNEDSQDVEFDETNLFSKNRFTGVDQIEGGTRATYGVRQSFIADGGGRIDLLTGQTYRLKANDQFPSDSGLRDQASDYVGRIDIVPGPWMDLNYGFLLKKNNLSPERQEVRGSAGVPEFRPFVNYLSIDQTLVNGVKTPLEEITAGFSSTVYKYYTFTVATDHAFRPDPGTRKLSLSADYRDECFSFGLTAQRDNTVRTDVSTGDSIIFHFYLRNIGGLQTDSVTTPSYAQSSLPLATSTSGK